MDIHEVETRLNMSGDDFDPCSFYGCSWRSTCTRDKRNCYKKMLTAIFNAVDKVYEGGGCSEDD